MNRTREERSDERAATNERMRFDGGGTVGRDAAERAQTKKESPESGYTVTVASRDGARARERRCVVTRV